MSPNLAACATAAALCLTLPTAVSAAVTPQDVWTNLTAYFQALGGASTAEPVIEGDTISIADFSTRFDLPLDTGTLDIGFGAVTLTGNGDGTVSVSHPPETSFTANLVITGYASVSLTARLSSSDYVTTASGEPGDIIYDYSAARYAVELTSATYSDLSIAGQKAAAVPDLSGSYSIAGSSGQYRITQGDLLRARLDASQGDASYAYSFSDAPGSIATQTSTYHGIRYSGSLALPANGTPLLWLPAALRDGLEIALESFVQQSDVSQTNSIDGQAVMNLELDVGSTTSTLTFDKNGFAFDAAAQSYAFAIADIPGVPEPIAGTIERAVGEFAVPLLDLGVPQQFIYSFAFTDISLSEAIWSLFDSEAALPRDPASLALDVRGTLSPSFDFVDFLSFAEFEGSGEAPALLHDVAIADLLLSAAGAALTGTGGFTFDNDDLETFGGIPAPTESIDLTLVGANALLDKLVAMGLLPEDQAMGARMMMGLFARPGDGEDTLTSKIEVDGATGAVSANGQRLQ